MDKTLVFDSNAGNCGCSPLEAAALSNCGFGGANAMLPAMMMGGGFERSDVPDVSERKRIARTEQTANGTNQE